MVLIQETLKQVQTSMEMAETRGVLRAVSVGPQLLDLHDLTGKYYQDNTLISGRTGHWTDHDMIQEDRPDNKNRSEIM